MVGVGGLAVHTNALGGKALLPHRKGLLLVWNLSILMRDAWMCRAASDIEGHRLGFLFAVWQQ